MSADETNSEPVKVTVAYGYDIHSIRLSVQILYKIRRGDAIEIKGQGFNWDGVTVEDLWEFNCDTAGSLYVRTDDGGEIYIGHLDDQEVQIEVDGVALPGTAPP